jgi:hypothetical protein
MPLAALTAGLKARSVFIDVKSAIDASKLRKDIFYWSL